MANVTIKRVGELVRSVFEILWNKPDGLTAREVLTLLPKTIPLTEEELKYSSSANLPRYERVVRLATIPLAHAGWLVKTEKGRWYISEEGYQACRKYVNIQDLYREAVLRYEERRQAVPESIMIIELAQEASWNQIEKHLHLMHHSRLQVMLAELLKAMGYFPSWMAPPEKERGHIDLIAFVDPLGAKGHRIIGQVKHRGQAVTLEGVRSFVSALGPNDFGLIFSTGGFTSETMQEMAGGSFQKVTILDPAAFFDLWIKYYDQLSQDARSILPIKVVHFLSKDP